MRWQYFENIYKAVVSIFEGMAVTFSYLLRPPTTVQYPDRIQEPVEKTLPERYRGIIEIDVNICIACAACQRVCPIDCIALKVEKDPETKERFITEASIDMSKCMFCGLCVEQCPTNGIRHTTEFAGATYRLEDLVLRFVKKGERKPVYKLLKGGEAPATQPVGEIARQMRECLLKK